MNKKALISILVFLWLVGCYMIGQVTHNGFDSTDEETMVIDATDTSLWKEVYTGNAEIIGFSESSDYPFGFNVGAIEDGEVGRSIFLTPGTKIIIPASSFRGEKVTLQTRIHPWVSESSDGAILSVNIVSDESGETTAYEVTNSDIIEFVINVDSVISSSTTVSFSVSNLEGKNESCDWVIIQEK